MLAQALSSNNQVMTKPRIRWSQVKSGMKGALHKWTKKKELKTMSNSISHLDSLVVWAEQVPEQQVF